MSTVTALHEAIDASLAKEFGISNPKIVKFLCGSFFSRRVHKHYAGYKSYSRDELAKVFGRNNFTTINSLHGLFELLPYSKHHGYTRGLKHSAKLISLFNKCIDSIEPDCDQDIESFTKTGGILTKDYRGNQAKFNSKILQAVRVNPVALRKMSQITPQDEDQQLIKIQAALMLDSALDTSKIKRGWIIQRYRQIKTGRVYSTGMSLQNCCREVRYAALSGLYGFDVDNCHWSMLTQLSTVETPYADHYVLNKNITRTSLSKQLGLSVDDVKTIIISIIYGASLPPVGAVFDPKNLKDDKYLLPAIARICQTKDVYTRVKDNDIIKGLCADKKRASNDIIANSIDKSGKCAGLLVNAMRIVCHETEQSKQLSHILQGYEAACLEAITEVTGTDTAALLHDGWVTYSHYDKAVFEKAIFNATGLKLTVDYESVKSFLCDDVNQPVDLAIVDDKQIDEALPCTLMKEYVSSPLIPIHNLPLPSSFNLNKILISPLLSLSNLHI